MQNDSNEPTESHGSGDIADAAEPVVIRDAQPADADADADAPDVGVLEVPEGVADEGADDDYGPPFVAKTFGGAFVWARGDGFVATVLRIREGKSVPVATQNRRDMHIMLTGGRAVLEVDNGTEVDRVELLPAASIPVSSVNAYRLIAMTEVELFTVFTQG